MCWLKREADGEAALVDWLADPGRLWRLSDGFPHGYLPKPLCHPRSLSREDLKDHKERKQRLFIARDPWLRHRAAWNEFAVPNDAFRKDTTRMRHIAHNVVHRHGRGTLETGGLFFLDEDWRFASGEEGGSDPLVDLYIEAGEPRDAVKGLVKELGEAGFGRDASTGRGRWKVREIVEDRELAEGPGARRMSLSRGVLTPETMQDALWRVEPHFGRAGAQVALTGASPFKRPVLLTRPGATFRPAGEGLFGRWITDVHPERPEIGLNGLHIAIPFNEAEAT